MSVLTHLYMFAGTDFSQKLEIKNYDFSPRDITGMTFTARMMKNPSSINVTTSTSDQLVYRAIPLTAVISDAENGVYEISLDSTITTKIPEGKFVYSVVMDDGNGTIEEVHSGLMFVAQSTRPGSALDPNYP